MNPRRSCWRGFAPQLSPTAKSAMPDAHREARNQIGSQAGDRRLTRHLASVEPKISGTARPVQEDRERLADKYHTQATTHAHGNGCTRRADSGGPRIREPLLLRAP